MTYFYDGFSYNKLERRLRGVHPFWRRPTLFENPKSTTIALGYCFLARSDRSPRWILPTSPEAPKRFSPGVAGMSAVRWTQKPGGWSMLKETQYFGEFWRFVHGTSGVLLHWKFLKSLMYVLVCGCILCFLFFQQILERIMDDWNVWTLWNVCVSFNCWSYRLTLSMWSYRLPSGLDSTYHVSRCMNWVWEHKRINFIHFLSSSHFMATGIRYHFWMPHHCYNHFQILLSLEHPFLARWHFVGEDSDPFLCWGASQKQFPLRFEQYHEPREREISRGKVPCFSGQVQEVLLDEAIKILPPK